MCTYLVHPFKVENPIVMDVEQASWKAVSYNLEEAIYKKVKLKRSCQIYKSP